MQLFRTFSLLVLAGVRMGVASGRAKEVEEQDARCCDEGLGVGFGLELAELGVTIELDGMMEARCGVDAAVGVEEDPDSSWRRRDGVAAAGVAVAEAPKKLLKRSLGEFS
jgi:hypothetical protein